MNKETPEIIEQGSGESHSDNQLVQGIIDSSIEETDSDDSSSDLIKISYGSKDMILKLRSGMAVSGGLLATTYIENVRSSEKKKDKETALLYLAIRDILHEFANKKQKAVYYMFDTENPNMLEWAKTKGRDIFNWDKEEIELENEGRGVFTKIFQP